VKARVTFSIEEGIKNRLYDHVKAKYHGFKGGLSLEVEDAIVAWLNDNTHISTHKKEDNVNPQFSRVEHKLEQIFRILKGQGLLISFSQRDFEVACSKIVGSDFRTVRKYLDWGVKLHKIRHKTGVVWEYVSEEELDR